MKITANIKNKEFTLQVKVAEVNNFNGEAFGTLKWVKGGAIHTAYLDVVSDGANQFVEWKDHSKLTEAMADHFSPLVKLMYDIQNSENLLYSVREDLEKNAPQLSPEDVQELKKCEADLLETILEDRQNLFQKRGL